MSPMNGSQLYTLRTSQGLSLREVAQRLTDAGHDVTHTTLSRWERSTDTIPPWVSATLLGQTPLEIPLSELQHLLDYARHRDISFRALLGEAISQYLAAHPLPYTEDQYHRDRAADAAQPIDTAGSPGSGEDVQPSAAPDPIAKLATLAKEAYAASKTSTPPPTRKEQTG